MTSAQARRGHSRWFRILRSIVEIALAVVAGYAIFTQRHNFALAIGLFARLRWGWVGIAILSEMASMGAFARMQRWLLRIGGITLHLFAMVEITLAGNAISVSLPGGVAWSTVWALEQLRRRAAPRHLVVWVLVVSGVLSSVTISGILIAGVWIAGDKGPSSELRWPLLAVAITLIGGCVLVVYHQQSRTVRGETSKLLARFSPGSRVRKAIEEIGRYARTVDPRWQDWTASLFFALMNWFADIGCLVASMIALHIAVPWYGILATYGVTQLAASLPITPGGIGVVEGSLSLMLAAYGLPLSDAVAAALLYRVISFWVLVPIGWITWAIIKLRQRGTSVQVRDE